VEVIVGWNRDKYPFRTVRIPYRKKKYVSPINKFAQFSRDFMQMIEIEGITVMNDSRIITTDTYRSKGEQFYDIRLSKVKFIKLDPELVRKALKSIDYHDTYPDKLS
jgi:hypothetical protein